MHFKELNPFQSGQAAESQGTALSTYLVENKDQMNGSQYNYHDDHALDTASAFSVHVFRGSQAAQGDTRGGPTGDAACPSLTMKSL